MEKQTITEILNAIRTKEEAGTVLSDIEVLRTSYFEVSAEKRKETLGKVSYKSAHLFENLLAQAGSDHAFFEALLAELSDKIKALPVLKLTIAFEPRQSTLDVLHGFIMENIAKNAILDLSIDPSILGGAQIAFLGVYKDLSLRKKLDAVFESKKEEILGSLSI